MGDAIFLGEATGVYQPSLRFHVSQSKSHIDSRARGGFDLGEDMLAIQGNYSLAGTGLNVFTNFEAGFQQRVIDWAKVSLPAREHGFNVSLSRLEVCIRIAYLAALTLSAFRQPPRGVSAQSMFGLQPLAARLLIF